MAKFVLKDADVSVSDVDISDHVSSVTINTERDQVDVTSMGATNKESLAGLGDATITLEVFQDFAASELDSTMWPLSTTDTPFEVKIKPTSAAVSSSNPMYIMSSLLYTYSPLDGTVGEASTTTLEFRNASQDGLVRITDPSSS